MFHQRYLFCEMGKKTFYLLDRKVKKKNQISKYYAPSSKEYNED